MRQSHNFRLSQSHNYAPGISQSCARFPAKPLSLINSAHPTLSVSEYSGSLDRRSFVFNALPVPQL
jgi:hypothetical protein